MPSSDEQKAAHVTAVNMTAAEQVTVSSAANKDLPVLPPQDRGLAAWRALTAAILIQALPFGLPLTFGVFQNYLRQDAKFSDSSQSIWIGVLSTGVPFMGAPLMTCICKTYPHIDRRYYVLLGWAICVVSLVGASFCTSVLALAMTQGLLYGVGLFVMDAPVLLILNTWFDRRRGFAYGILFCIIDLFGFVFAFTTESLLARCGLRWTLVTFAAIVLVISGPAVFFLKPRPGTEMECGSSPLAVLRRCAANAKRYSRQYIFYLFTISNLCQAFAFYLPYMYLPSYTTDLGYTATQGSLVLAIANLAQIFGELLFGMLSDKVNVYPLIVLSSLAASLAAVTLWGLAHSFVQLIFFALVFGASSSGFISLWAAIGSAFGEENSQMIFSILSFCRGLASVVSGPISLSLLRTLPAPITAPAHHPHVYGNRKYTGVILFVGVCLAGSALMGGLGLVAGLGKKPGRAKTEVAQNTRQDSSPPSGVEV